VVKHLQTQKGGNKLVGKTKIQKTFFDIAVEHKVSKEHILMKINRLINWKPFEKKLSKLYHPQIGLLHILH